MDDNRIVDLYWKRSEQAITETSMKYGKYCYAIAYNILYNNEDSEESVNDTYLAAWNSMPPKRPDILSAFLGKITRYISIDRWKNRMALKRGGGEIPLVLEELEECVSAKMSVEEEYLKKELLEGINQFLADLPETERKVFMYRYWNLDSIERISKRYGYSTSKVTSMLYRIRGKFRKFFVMKAIVLQMQDSFIGAHKL